MAKAQQLRWEIARPTSRNKDGLDTEANITAPLGLTASRFAVWQKNRPWLQVKSDGSGLVYCSYCADVKGLGMHAPERVRIEKAFVDGISVAEVTKKKLKKLNDKISAHGNCISHKYCCEFIAARGKNALENSLKNNRELWYKQNQQKIDVTTRVFRTAYMCCMRYEPFTAQPEILRLQQLNGVDVGRNLYSDHACRNLVCYIGQQMRQKLLHYVLQTSDSAFSLMFDESTSVSTETCLIMYIRIVYANEICNFFLDLVELKSQSGESIADAIVNVFTTYGFTEEILQSRLIGVCTDGASNLQGAVNGALAHMKAKLKTDFMVFHCMAHKLELAISDVIKLVTEIGHLQSFTDALYAHFSRSPKNQNQLKSIAVDLHVHLLKVCRTFDIRWVASSYRSVHAIWESYQALVNHFQFCSTDTTRNARERAKCTGLHQKLIKWFFVSELAIVHDALEFYVRCHCSCRNAGRLSLLPKQKYRTL